MFLRYLVLIAVALSTFASLSAYSKDEDLDVVEFKAVADQMITLLRPLTLDTYSYRKWKDFKDAVRDYSVVMTNDFLATNKEKRADLLAINKKKLVVKVNRVEWLNRYGNQDKTVLTVAHAYFNSIGREGLENYRESKRVLSLLKKLGLGTSFNVTVEDDFPLQLEGKWLCTSVDQPREKNFISLKKDSANGKPKLLVEWLDQRPYPGAVISFEAGLYLRKKGLLMGVLNAVMRHEDENEITTMVDGRLSVKFVPAAQDTLEIERTSLHREDTFKSFWGRSDRFKCVR